MLAATLLSVALAALIVVGGKALAAAVGAAGLALILASARFRLVFIVFVGMAVFQSSAEVSTAKTGYVIGAMLAICVAAAESIRHRDARAEPAFNVVFLCSVLLLGVLSAPTAVGVMSGTDLTSAVRDALPYVLLAASPVLALDAARGFDQRALRGIFATVGALAGIGFAINWLNRRGLATIGVAHLLLSSFILCGAAVSYAVSRVVDGSERGRLPWLILACAVPGFIFVTGTRAGLLLLVIPMVMFLIASRLTILQRVVYGVVGFAAAIAVIAVVALTLVSVFGVDRARLDERLSSIPGFRSTALATASLDERAAERRDAIQVWKQHPVVGAGAGVQFRWVSPTGVNRSAFTIDSLLSFPAKFGVIGVIALLAWLAAVGRLTMKRRRAGAQIAGDALIVFAVFAALYGYLASPLEEKGLAFALIFMFALLLVESGWRRRPSTVE